MHSICNNAFDSMFGKWIWMVAQNSGIQCPLWIEIMVQFYGGKWSHSQRALPIITDDECPLRYTVPHSIQGGLVLVTPGSSTFSGWKDKWNREHKDGCHVLFKTIHCRLSFLRSIIHHSDEYQGTIPSTSISCLDLVSAVISLYPFMRSLSLSTVALST